MRSAARLAVTLAVVAAIGVAGADAAATRRIAVPNVVGKQKAVAQLRLQRVALRSRVVYVHSNATVGTVVAQRPAAGARALVGTRVAITVSSGPGP